MERVGGSGPHGLGRYLLFFTEYFQTVRQNPESIWVSIGVTDIEVISEQEGTDVYED